MTEEESEESINSARKGEIDYGTKIIVQPSIKKQNADIKKKQEEVKKKKTGYKCGGLCFTGPCAGSLPPTAIFVAIVIMTSFNASMFIFALGLNEITISVLFAIMTCLGVWSAILWLFSWCSDPGVITWENNTSDLAVSKEFGDFSDGELECFDTDPIFKIS